MSNSIARVYVNNVEVGSLPIAQYEAVVKEVKGRWIEGMLVQFANIIVGLMRFLYLYLQYVLILSLIFGGGIILSSPEFCANLIQLLRTAPAHELANSLKYFTSLALILSLFFCVIAFTLTSYRFGVRNMFTDTIHRRLLYILEVPTHGDIKVIIDHGN